MRTWMPWKANCEPPALTARSGAELWTISKRRSSTCWPLKGRSRPAWPMSTRCSHDSIRRAQYSDKQTWPAEPSAALPRISEPRLCRHAKQAALCLAAGLAGLIVSGMMLVPQSVYGPPPPPLPVWYESLMLGLLIVAAVAAVVGPVLGTGLGWVAVERIRGSNGRLYGTALAVIEALLVPLVIIWLGTYACEYWFEVMQFGNRAGAVMQLTGMERERLVAYRVIWVACALALSFVLGWILWYLTGDKRTAASWAATKTGPTSVLATSK